jgi:hypothetical protein
MKRKFERTGNKPPSLQGHTCRVCNAIGDHLEDACPSRSLVHMPRTFRKEVHERTVAEVRETFFVPPNFIPGGELYALLRARFDVPPGLRCVACALLAHDAVWCACCDVVACAACVGPATEPYVCGRCGDVGPDSFHVVSALRTLCDNWVHAMTRRVDSATFESGVRGSGAAGVPASVAPYRHKKHGDQV